MMDDVSLSVDDPAQPGAAPATAPRAHRRVLADFFKDDRERPTSEVGTSTLTMGVATGMAQMFRRSTMTVTKMTTPRSQAKPSDASVTVARYLLSVWRRSTL